MSTKNLNFQDYDPKVKSLVDKITYEAEQSVIQDFPNCIGELEKLLQDERLDLAKTSKIQVDTNVPVPFATASSSTTTPNGAPPSSNKRKRTSSESGDSGFQVETLKGGTKVLVLPSGTIPSNHHIQSLIQELKPKITTMVENVSRLRMWITFAIPKIEDGNNFGVGIQEEALEEIKAVEAEAASYYDHFSRYYLTRAKAVSKVAKYPHIEDFRQLVREIDEKQIHELRSNVIELKNNYASIYDLILKNYDKIKKPKSNNASIMF